MGKGRAMLWGPCGRAGGLRNAMGLLWVARRPLRSWSSSQGWAGVVGRVDEWDGVWASG